MFSGLTSPDLGRQSFPKPLPLPVVWASLLAQMVKNLPTVKETQV